MRKLLPLARPLFLASVPFWLPQIPLPVAAYRSVVGSSAQRVLLESDAATGFRGVLVYSLGLVVLLQVFATLARLASLDGLAERRARFGRSALVVVTNLALAAFTARRTWGWVQYRASGDVDFLPGIVLSVGVALGVSVMALGCSRRGAWSGVLALLGGCYLREAWSVAPRVVARDQDLGGHLAGIALVAAAAYMVTIIVLRMIHGRENVSGDIREHLRASDVRFAPLAVPALALVLVGVLELLSTRESEAWEGMVLRVVHGSLLLFAVFGARILAPEPAALRRAGLGALGCPEELALVPWAVAWLARSLAGLRLAVAERGDPLLGQTSARWLEESRLPDAVLIVVWIATIVALGPYLRWIRSLPTTGGESPSPAAGAPSAPAG